MNAPADDADDSGITPAETSVEIAGSYLTLKCDRAPAATVGPQYAPFGCGFIDKASGKAATTTPKISSVSVSFAQAPAETPNLGAAKGDFSVTFGVSAYMVPSIKAFGATVKGETGEDKILSAPLPPFSPTGFPKTEIVSVSRAILNTSPFSAACPDLVTPLSKFFLQATSFCSQYCATAANFSDGKPGIGRFQACGAADGAPGIQCACTRGADPSKFTQQSTQLGALTATDLGAVAGCSVMTAGPSNTGFFQTETACTRLCQQDTVVEKSAVPLDEAKIGFMQSCTGNQLNCACAKSVLGDGTASAYVTFDRLPGLESLPDPTSCDSNEGYYPEISAGCAKFCTAHGYVSGFNHGCDKRNSPPSALCLCYR